MGSQTSWIDSAGRAFGGAAGRRRQAQEEVDAACADAGIYDWESCNGFLSGGAEESYEEPVYEEPAYEEPAYEKPAYEEPVYEEPTYEEPTYEEPAYEDEPVYEEEEPAYEEEMSADEPVFEDETVEEEPVFEEEATEEEPIFEDEATDADEFTAEDEEVYSEDEVSVDEDEITSEDEATSDEEEISEEDATFEEDAISEDDATAEDDVAEDEVTEDDAEASDATAFVESDGVQEEVIEDLPEDIDPSLVEPMLDSVKDDSDLGAAEEPEYVPTDDENARAFSAPELEDPIAEAEVLEELSVAPEAFAAPDDVEVLESSDGVVVYEFNNTVIVNNYYEDQSRLAYGADDVIYTSYADGSYSDSVIAADGSQVITIRDAYGNIISRTYYDAYGNEYVLAWYDPAYREDERMYWYDVGYELPPLYVAVPRDDYIYFYDRSDAYDLIRFFGLPPVEPVRRLYTIDEVKRSARLRDSMPRVEIGNLNFANGSAGISRSQAGKLEDLADAILDAVDRNPAETFLIEGHTDAPGSDRDNLVLSDQRAAAVARALTEYYGVPPWNLATQGYGERYLKINTQRSESANRRVTVRRITPLVTVSQR
ncbi:OmpA family protein [Devosia aurantiaca]|uniref:OmpA family protein n=1 Tax=Devosia aurantiaca TaxID=2714858 RepID=A0A6M1SZV4_9HYPH|nr:OmpA family protein [Devosia aurantiaca]NGP18181.1 OmpA family protein [Devosia aurantiaca]